MKFTIEKFDYLLIQSGYTSRLLTKLGLEITDVIKQETDPKAARGDGIFTISPHGQYINDEDSDEILFDVIDRILFIRDGLYGNGLYKMDGKEQYIKTVFRILDKNSVDCDGTICFKTDKGGLPLLDHYLDIKQTLEETGYCFFGNMYSVTYLEEDGKSVCIIKHDCESG